MFSADICSRVVSENAFCLYYALLARFRAESRNPYHWVAHLRLAITPGMTDRQAIELLRFWLRTWTPHPHTPTKKKKC